MARRKAAKSVSPWEAKRVLELGWMTAAKSGAQRARVLVGVWEEQRARATAAKSGAQREAEKVWEWDSTKAWGLARLSVVV